VILSSPTATFDSVSRIDPQFDAIDRLVRVGNVVCATRRRAETPCGVRPTAVLWPAAGNGNL
jgi:hypothetical protein